MNIPKHNTDLITALEAARTEDAQSQTKLAKMLGCNAGTLSKYLNQKYNGDVAELNPKSPNTSTTAKTHAASNPRYSQPPSPKPSPVQSI